MKLDLADRLAIGHRIGIPAYYIGAVVLLFFYPPTREFFFLFVTTYSLFALGISLGYHRLFSHRSFQPNRVLNFLLALFGGLAGQGAIRRWVYHHRNHHRFTEKPGDPHSPRIHGLWRAHLGWRFLRESYINEEETKKIWAEWPREVVLLDRAIPTLFFVYPIVLWWMGGAAYVEWGCLMPICLLWQVTFTVNSISHRFGRRLFETPDDSRNNWILSVLMWGEGWHNNHHASPKSARYGVRWYQFDSGYYLLKAFQKVGFVRHLVETSEVEIRAALKNSQK